MRGPAALSVFSTAVAVALLCGCSGAHPMPTGPVSTPNAGKAAFTQAKAIEKIYRAGYTGISLATRDRDGVWRGRAIKRGSGASAPITVTEDGPVLSR